MELTSDITRIILAIGINAVAALSAYLGKVVSRSGAIGGFVVGALIYFFTDWRGWTVLVFFFVLGTLVTRVKYQEKARMGIAQEEGGRRGAKHAVANCLASLILGFLAWLMHTYGNDLSARLLMAGFCGAFATALSDTASSEMGQAYGKTTILLTSFKRVPPGTEGAVSMEGTLAGIFASAMIALVALLAGVILAWQGFVAVIVAAFIGNTLESVIGSTIEQLPVVTNEVTNFLNTLIGAGAAIGLYALLT
jgi:uncharacterized protein (TIGR00297 family)